MKTLAIALGSLLFVSTLAAAQTPAAGAGAGKLRAILLEQLHTTHDKQDWFVTGTAAARGLTAEQASWSPGKGNHSVGQLVQHLVYWNRQVLARLQGRKLPTVSNNDQTFDQFNAESWTKLQAEFAQVMRELERLTESASDEQLERWASDLAHIGAHNAYHIGQMITVRKLQGSWNPAEGVK